ncbi:MAG: efflux RND transporter periplasmic adaptor subunit [Burkholderiaceae bacterium]
MKNKKMIFAAAAVIALSATSYGLYRLGMNQGMKMTAPSMTNSTESTAASGQSSGNADKKVLYWHDPMVPAQKFDKPGKSPFMDMPLVPVYADAAGDEGTVSISPRVQQNLGIRTAEVTKGKLASVVVAVGSVAYNERDVALVQARSNGFVERLYVRAPLDPVKKGQALAELYVPEWVAAQEEYLSVKRMQSSGVDDSLALLLSGARQRMRLVGMSDAQIRLVESSGKLHPRLTITAPIGGVISELNVRDGMTVMTGAPLFRINGLGTIWVNADIPENLSAQVRPGNTVEARTPSLPGTVLKGKVGAILPEVNAATRTLKARVELANPSGQLVPGMFATLNFSATPGADVLLVPTEAVIKTGTRSVVMAALGDGKFIPVDVEIGTETNGHTEIRKGLEEGQKVVVSGQFLIDSEASLRGSTTRMAEMAAQDSNQAAGPTHRAEGKVERIEQDEITISHGPIPSLQWGAMTMGFNVPASGLPKNIAVGDKVAFEIRAAKDGMFEIATIAPITAAPAMDGMPAGAAK